LLFLCAGSVIHAVHSNFLKDMGGLRKYMPITNITFLIAALAIAGVPPLAGFWSKDEILVATFEHSLFLYVIGLFVAGLTAFYIFRIYFGIFWGKESNYKDKPHESPGSMTAPLLILAFLSIVVGFIPFSEFISPDKAGFETHLNYPLAAIAVFAGLLGIGLSWIFYKKENELADKFASRFGAFYTWACHKFYFDELYLFVTKRILFNVIAKTAARFDKKYVDGTMVGIGNQTVSTSERIKVMQSGKVQDYALAFIAGAVVLAIICIYLWLN
ncbi:MAG: NADH-quinone oxidoreductase subunit L, partial [Eudoraea sp.]|nr:NADH-quinone oxidoreductase subunit L [Eudoraea sp.]